jgi:hypothetical protein
MTSGGLDFDSFMRKADKRETAAQTRQGSTQGDQKA